MGEKRVSNTNLRYLYGIARWGTAGGTSGIVGIGGTAVEPG
jgi:hypothetical protein